MLNHNILSPCLILNASLLSWKNKNKMVNCGSSRMQMRCVQLKPYSDLVMFCCRCHCRFFSYTKYHIYTSAKTNKCITILLLNSDKSPQLVCLDWLKVKHLNLWSNIRPERVMMGHLEKRFASTFFAFLVFFYYPHKWRMTTSIAQFYSFVLSQFPCSVWSQTFGRLHTVSLFKHTEWICWEITSKWVCVTACQDSSQSENGKSFWIRHFVSNKIASLALSKVDISLPLATNFRWHSPPVLLTTLPTHSHFSSTLVTS